MVASSLSNSWSTPITSCPKYTRLSSTRQSGQLESETPSGTASQTLVLTVGRAVGGVEGGEQVGRGLRRGDRAGQDQLGEPQPARRHLPAAAQSPTPHRRHPRALANTTRPHRHHRHRHHPPQQPPALHRRGPPPRPHRSPHDHQQPQHPNHQPQHRRTPSASSPSTPTATTNPNPKPDPRVGSRCSYVSRHHIVGQAGFEPTTSSSRTRRATKLRHCPCAAPEMLPEADAGHALRPWRLRRPGWRPPSGIGASG